MKFEVGDIISHGDGSDIWKVEMIIDNDHFLLSPVNVKYLYGYKKDHTDYYPFSTVGNCWELDKRYMKQKQWNEEIKIIVEDLDRGEKNEYKN